MRNADSRFMSDVDVGAARPLIQSRQRCRSSGEARASPGDASLAALIDFPIFEGEADGLLSSESA